MSTSLQIASFTALLCFVFLVLGCGGGGSASAGIGAAPTITVQPLSQSVPLGGSATFTVVANSSTPLRYQWSDNGNAIAGATSASVSVSSLAISHSGDKFTVTISNDSGSVVSSTAVLTLGPRTPDPHDLRFQHVGISQQQLSGGYLSNVTATSAGSETSSFYANSVGTGLLIGSLGVCAGTFPTTGNCSWSFVASNPPAGGPSFVSYYAGDQLANLPAELLKAGNTSNAVVTTLDEIPQFGVMAVSVEQDPSVSSGFVQEVDSVLPSGLTTLAQQLGSRGYIITALSGNASGALDVVAYHYAGAVAATYETYTVQADSSGIGPQAATLAANGYIMTALGQNGTNSFLAIGTRLSGDIIPRPFSYSTGNTVVGTTDASAVRVGAVYGTNGQVTFLEQ